MVELPVSLGPGGAHSRAFLGVQSTELNASLVDIFGHFPAQSIDFFDQLTFG
jgi:hypothetical protein